MADPEFELSLMVEEQLFERGIRDPAVLDAFLTVDRRSFLPAARVHESYLDAPSSLACGQTISQPYIVARMLEYLEVAPGQRVLEIGTGSGYTAALLAQMRVQVDSMDIFPELLGMASNNLRGMGLDRIRLFQGSGWSAPPGKAYDRIVVWAAPPRLPKELTTSLAAAGIMVLPIGKQDQFIHVYRKMTQELKQEIRDAVRFVPLIREEMEPHLWETGED